MRPVRLTMQAFGSYGKKTEIDFTVPDQKLFLITGDTGSGKTTIFDAVVFALYGEAGSVSSKKDGIELQSQYAGTELLPYVELCFTKRNGDTEEEYIVRRSPRHLRPARRSGAKAQAVSETVSLIMPDGSEYPGRETDEKLTEIVGLDKNQFMQVAMIAQGEFMELLRADSNRKKEIFRKLFGTELYRNIVEELFLRRKEKQNEIDRIKTACQTETGHITIPEGYKCSTELSELKNRIMSGDRLNTADIEQMTDKLAELCEEMKLRLAGEEERTAALGLLRDSRRDEVTRARALLGSYDQMEAASEMLRKCEAEEESIRQYSEGIRLINDAYEVREQYNLYHEAKKAVSETEKELKENRNVVPELAVKLERLREEEKKAAAEAEERLKEYTTIKEKAQRSEQILKKAGELRRILEQKQLEYLTAKEKSREAGNAFRAYEEQEKEWRNRKAGLSDTDRRTAELKALIRETDMVSDEYSAAQNAYLEYVAAAAEAAKAEEDYELSRTEYSQKKTEYEKKNEQFLDAQAGFLAEKLEPGKPCPVCGSTEHPDPCVIRAEHEGVTRQIIEVLSAETAELEQKRSELSQRAGAAKELLKEKSRFCTEASERAFSAFDALLKRLREVQEISLPDIEKETGNDEKQRTSIEYLEKIGILLKEEERRLEESAKELEELRKKLANTDENREKLRLEAEKAAKDAEGSRVEAAAAEAGLRGLKDQAEYETEASAQRAVSEAESRKTTSEIRAQAVRERVSEAKTEKEKAETLIERCIASMPELKAVMDSRKAGYEAVMEQKRLSFEQWREVVEMHSREDASKYQGYIDEHNRKRAAARSAYETAAAAVDGSARPDMEKLQEEEKEAAAAFDASARTLEELKSCLRIDRTALKALKAHTGERVRVLDEFVRIDSLYERLAGKRTGARMDIETFVQRYYMKRVLRAANRRFSEMSAGQYELRMTGEDMAGEGRNRGLDLMVYSAVTGKEREIKTLSGGESFMAALSMALGMADMISESSSSIDLEMMFIDEGFGSLDDNSRNQAVRVLQQMAEGSRLIGIISHVSELKQAIDNKLVVTKDAWGSHAEWAR